MICPTSSLLICALYVADTGDRRPLLPRRVRHLDVHVMTTDKLINSSGVGLIKDGCATWPTDS